MKLYLAPMQGMTSAKYRNLYNEIFGGIDVYYSPFIATRGKEKVGNVIFKDLIKEDNNTILIPQLLGNNGSDFNRFAKIIKGMGYDEINWNIGCPYPTVTKKKKGSGILPYPDLLKAFLDEVCKDLDYKFSVKMRLGMYDYKEGRDIIEILNDYPIDSVIIHGRLGQQKYEGVVNLDEFKTLYEATRHRIVYNGDIYSVDDYKRIQEMFPDIDEFMLGRGGLRDPFLPSDIKGINHSNRLEKILLFHDQYYAYLKESLSGDKHLLDRMKGFWTYLAYNLDDGEKWLKKIKKSNNSPKYEAVVKDLFNNQTLWK